MVAALHQLAEIPTDEYCTSVPVPPEVEPPPTCSTQDHPSNNNSLSMCTFDKDNSSPLLQVGGLLCQSAAVAHPSISQFSFDTEPPMPSTGSPPAATSAINTNTTTTTRTRKVYFGLQYNQVIPPPCRNATSSLLDQHQRWYSKFEYQAWEAILAKQAKHLRQEPPRPFSYAHTWEHLDHVCHHAVDTNAAAAATGSTMPWQLPLAERHALERLVAKGAPIGLERWAVPRLEKHGEARKQQLYKAVGGHAGSTPREGGCHSHHSKEVATQEEEREEHLAYQCQRISRPSRLLATAMGQALAAVLRRDADNQPR